MMHFRLIFVGIFSKCLLGKAIKENLFDAPAPQKLPDSDVVLPYVVLGDEAFPLLNNLMKPYPRNQSLVDRTKAIYNYRLSRARRMVENAFGILTHRFRIFSTPIHLNVCTLENAVTSACIIHNMLMDEKAHAEYDDPDNSFGFNEENLVSMDNCEEIEPQQEPIEIRNRFREYFTTVGAVSWQNETIRL